MDVKACTLDIYNSQSVLIIQPRNRRDPTDALLQTHGYTFKQRRLAEKVAITAWMHSVLRAVLGGGKESFLFHLNLFKIPLLN